jgi:predicted nucleotidyltransferase
MALEFSEAALKRLCREFHVRELSLFGSVLRPDFHEASDVDLLVEFDPEARVGLLALSRLQRELADLFGRKVDLVPKGGLKPAIRQEVLAQARTLYAA